MTHKPFPGVFLAAICSSVLAITVARAQNEAPPNEPPTVNKLVEAVRASDSAKVAQILKAGVAPDARLWGRVSALEIAVRYGDAKVLREFVKAGADFDDALEGLNGWSPLEYVLLRTDVSPETIELLLEAGQKVEGGQWLYVPAAMTHAAMTNVKVMQVLVRAGADVNAVSANGYWSALDYAVVYSTVDSVKFLLTSGASAKRVSPIRRTVWHALAVRLRPEGADEIARMLKEHGAGDIAAAGADQFTPLDRASYAKLSANVRALVSAGADVNRRSAGGQTPLMQAALSADAATIKTLLELKADPNAVDDHGCGALYWAICAADPRLRTWNERDGQGEPQNSLFDDIDQSDPVGKIKALLAAGADPNRGAPPEWTNLALAATIWDTSTYGRTRGRRAGAADAVGVGGEGGAGAGGFSVKRYQFFERHDPTEVVSILVQAGATRLSEPGVADALDIAAQRTDKYRRSVLDAVRKAKVGN